MTAIRRRTVPAILAVLACSASAGWAQTPAAPDSLTAKSLEELLSVEVDSVVGASRYPQRLADAPAAVTIVTADDIRTFGWQTLADVLQSVRGLHVTNDRNYSYLGVRGFGRPSDYNNRVLITVDGHRVNDTVYDAGAIGADFPVDLALVERVEVIRGPGSALYGTSAFFAVINVVTRRGTTLGSSAAFEGGSLGSYRGRATYGWGGGPTRDVVMSATQAHSDGRRDLYFPEFDAPDTGGGHALDQDAERATHLYAAATLGRWRLQGVAVERAKDVPTASWGTLFGDRSFETTDQRGWISGSYERPLGAATILARGYYDFYDYSAVMPFVEGPTLVRADDHARMDLVGGELSVRRTVRSRHFVVAGVEHRRNLRQDQGLEYDGVVQIDAPGSTREYAAYLQDEISLSPRWRAIVGGRFDWWSHYGNGTGRPRLGLIYQTDYDTAIKLLYGEAYRAPSMYELHYYLDPAVAPAALAPESLRTTELVFERVLRRRIRLAASAYYTSIRDLIDQDLSADGEVVHGNNAAVRTHGVEFEAEGRWASGLLVRGSVSMQHAHDLHHHDLSNAPHKLATLQVAVPAWRRQLRLSTDTTYVSSRLTAAGSPLSGTALTNATVRYEPQRVPLTIGASVYNLFDRRYDHPVGLEFVQPAIEQNGRTFAVRASVRF